MNKTYRIININLTTILSDEPITSVPCNDCNYCCKLLSPLLSPEELSSGLYPISLIQPTKEEIIANQEVGPIVSLYQKKEGGCGMLIDGKCSIYEYRPVSCRQFDCRKGHHPKIHNMTIA
jgi:Fe-S-cluster containining protein